MEPQAQAIAPFRVGPLLPAEAVDFAGLTFARLARRLDDLPPGWLAVGARGPEGTPAGLALGSILPIPEGQEGYLLSLMVAPTLRRRGLGRTLLAGFGKAASAAGARRLRAVHTDFLPARAALEATLAASGWGPRRLQCMRFHWEAETAAARAAGWPSLARRLLRSSLYRCDPWTPPGEAEAGAVARLMAQPGYVPSMDFPRFSREADPDVSLWLRRGEEVVGWIIASPPAETPDGRVQVVYPSAYLDETLWHTGLLVAGYWQACTRQARVHGPRSLGRFDTVMPRNQVLLRRRLAPLGFRVDETYETLGPVD